MIFEEIICNISEKFIDAWESMDINKIVCCLSDDVCLKSPTISLIYPDNIDNIIYGKEEVKKYWVEATQKLGVIRAEKNVIVKENEKVATLITTTTEGIIIKQTFAVDEYGKIKELIYEYSKPLIKN